MRNLAEAESAWSALAQYHSLDNLKATINSPNSPTSNARSAAWKAFLLLKDVDTGTWPSRLTASRQVYASLQSHYLHNLVDADELDDPLSEDTTSRWNTLRQDEELRTEIARDLQRMPDNLYFSEPQTQEKLLGILFIWSKLNPDVSYRQGMHEVLAPVLWVVERDAVEPSSSSADKSGAGTFFDASYIAHDTFTLFGLIMQHHKEAYAVGSTVSAMARAKTPTDADSPMVRRCKHIMDVLLATFDPDLASHLKEIEIVPQVFLLRWIRLLFGREFSFDQTLELWDNAFAHGPTLSCVDFICIAMLLRIRWQLVNATYDEALPLLLRFPAPPPEHPPWSLVNDAIYLQNNLNSQGGAYVITKYSGRTLPISKYTRPSTPRIDSNQHSVDQHTPRRAFSPFATPSRLIQESGGFDSLLKEAARGVYLRGEEWGVNKAVRDAVGEVRKNVQTLQSRSPIAGSTFESSISGQAMSRDDAKSGEALLTKIDELHQRNKALASMLQSAVGDLWVQQESTAADDQTTKKFTMAVARVQLVQVYLEDSSLGLAPEEVLSNPGEVRTGPPSVGDSPKAPRAATQLAPIASAIGAQPEASIATTNPLRSTPAAPTETSKPTRAATKATRSRPSKTATALSNPEPAAQPRNHTSRPSLQSSFSWMLGQPQEDSPNKPTSSNHGPSRSLFDSPFAAASSPYASSPPQSRTRANATRAKSSFLFGDVDELAPEAANNMGSSVETMDEEEKARRRGSKTKVKGGKKTGVDEEEIVQLDDM